MALIGTIRNNMWFVFVLIALATGAFILMDAQGPQGGASTSTPIGVINGDKITNTEFDRAYQTLFSNAQDPHSSRAGLWNYFIEQKLVNKESEDLGLHVGYDELMDLQFGQNISPIIYQNFLNPQTGQIDFAQLQQVKQTLETGGELNPSFRQFWAEQEKQIKKSQLQTKLNNLTQKAIYTPNWRAELAFKEENEAANIAVVKIPFDNIPSGDITVSDSDIRTYLENNSSDFETKKENRVVDFVALNVYPSSADTASWNEEMKTTIVSFEATEEDSIFALNNDGVYRNYYSKVEEIDEFYRDKLPSFDIGKVYGPYILGGSYQAVKLVDKRIVPDSVKARHILRRVTAGNLVELAEANQLIDSLITDLERRRTPFDTLAAKFSQDLSNNLNGGDLGYFLQGDMVPAFNKATFLDGREGNYTKVITQFGVHLLYVEDLVFNTRESKYNMAYVNVPIIPRKETQNAAYATMIEYLSTYPYLDELSEAIDQDPGFVIEKSNDLEINGYSISNLGTGNTAREIIKWAFNGSTDLNDVSPSVFTFTDPIDYYNNKYVIAGLSQIKKPGLPSPADVRSQVEFTILNQLKGESLLSKINATDLESIASEYNVQVDTLLNLNLLNTFVAGLGNEPKVLGAAFNEGRVESTVTILGNSGVFVMQVLEKTEAGEITNLSFLKKSISDRTKGNVPLLLLDAFKKNVKIKDNRAVFF